MLRLLKNISGQTITLYSGRTDFNTVTIPAEDVINYDTVVIEDLESINYNKYLFDFYISKSWLTLITIKSATTLPSVPTPSLSKYIAILEYANIGYETSATVDAYESTSIYTALPWGDIVLGGFHLAKYNLSSNTFININTSNSFGVIETPVQYVYASKDVIFAVDTNLSMYTISATTGALLSTTNINGVDFNPNSLVDGQLLAAANYNNELFYAVQGLIGATYVVEFRKWSYATGTSTLLKSELGNATYGSARLVIAFAGPNKTYPYLSWQDATGNPDGYHDYYITVCDEFGSAYVETLTLMVGTNFVVNLPQINRVNSTTYNVWFGFNNFGSSNGLCTGTIVSGTFTIGTTRSIGYDARTIDSLDAFAYSANANTLLYSPGSGTSTNFVSATSSLIEEYETINARLVYNYTSNTYQVNGTNIYHTNIFGGPFNQVDLYNYIWDIKVIECKDGYTAIIGRVTVGGV